MCPTGLNGSISRQAVLMPRFKTADISQESLAGRGIGASSSRRNIAVRRGTPLSVMRGGREAGIDKRAVDAIPVVVSDYEIASSLRKADPEIAVVVQPQNVRRRLFGVPIEHDFSPRARLDTAEAER